jgi:hypothetical protein
MNVMRDFYGTLWQLGSMSIGSEITEMEFQMREQEFCLEIWYVANFFYHVPY